MSGLIGIRPIICMSSAGKMVSIGKAKGRQNAINTLVDYVLTLGEDVLQHRLVIAQTDAMPLAQQVGAILREKFGEGLRIEYVDVNPTAGSHCGPNGVGICFHAKHR
jgi:fatty acid-binding protein DegV